MAHVFETALSELEPYIRRELELAAPLAQGATGPDVRRVQEWLDLHGHSVVVDGDFGPATALGVSRFQESRQLPATGGVDPQTYSALVAPMQQVLAQRLTQSVPVGTAVVEYARAHLAVHPREVGGPNSGPWVRLYMRGRQGADFPWCAGFVTFLIHQAAESLQIEPPVAGSFSCDTLAQQGRTAGTFLAEADAVPAALTPGSIFLVRSSPGDWTHTGVLTGASEATFDTIEGNTNDAGSREGVEVRARSRAYPGKDFLLL